MNKVGIIISLEKYELSSVGLNSVLYANKDASRIRQIFIEVFEIEPENIHEFINETATLENCGTSGELAYHLSTLPPNTTIYYYYVGHGFFLDGDNYLTVYDTSKIDLKSTSLSFTSVFLEQFKKSNACRLIAFIDACAESIKDNSRGIVNESINFHDYEYELGYEYVMFFSCSPGEKSYSSNTINHGVWTYFLAKAILDKDIEAVDSDGNITAASLTGYLRNRVLNFTLKEFKKSQTPYWITATNNDMVLVTSKENISFEDQIMKLYEELNDHCYLANLYMGSYDEDCVINNDSIIEEICWDISQKLPDDWNAILHEIFYYTKRIENNQQIKIPYSEKKEIMIRIRSLIDCISTDESDYDIMKH